MLIPLTDMFFHARIKKKINHLAYVTHGTVYTLRKYSCKMLKILRHHIAAAWEPCTGDSETILYYFCITPLITWLLCLLCSCVQGTIQQASGSCLEILRAVRNTTEGTKIFLLP